MTAASVNEYMYDKGWNDAIAAVVRLVVLNSEIERNIRKIRELERPSRVATGAIQ